MKRYINKNIVTVNEKELLCDDYIVLCKNKGSDKLEMLGNVSIRDMAIMLIPLFDLISNSLVLD